MLAEIRFSFPCPPEYEAELEKVFEGRLENGNSRGVIEQSRPGDLMINGRCQTGEVDQITRQLVRLGVGRSRLSFITFRTPDGNCQIRSLRNPLRVGIEDY